MSNTLETPRTGMKSYIGVKRVKAEPMTLGQYHALRKWSTGNDEDPNAEGYLVEYPGFPEQGIPDGYISWCPKNAFEHSNKEVTGLTFGFAITQLEAGNKCARRGWKDTKAFIVYMPSLYLPPYNTQDTNRKVNDRTAKWIGEDAPLDCPAYFARYTEDQQWQVGWKPDSEDCLANDWYVVE